MHSSPTYSITNLIADIVIVSIGAAIEIISINRKAVEQTTIIKGRLVYIFSFMVKI
jgi:hypothetical protein